MYIDAVLLYKSGDSSSLRPISQAPNEILAASARPGMEAATYPFLSDIASIVTQRIRVSEDCRHTVEWMIDAKSLV